MAPFMDEVPCGRKSKNGWCVCVCVCVCVVNKLTILNKESLYGRNKILVLLFYVLYVIMRPQE